MILKNNIKNEIYSYIHIPFCELKCKYCRFASVWSLQKLKVDFYVKKLLNEIKKSSFQKGILNSIYFWWWTPSVLSESQLKDIIYEFKKKYIFLNDIEITLESTPNNITEENLIIWNKLWINRLSIWIETLNQKSLDEINRWNKGDISKCFENLNNFYLTDFQDIKKENNIINKFDNISLDFIIWLPYVKSWEILDNIKYILNKYEFIKHISVYMLEEYYNPDKIIETKFDNIVYPNNWDKLWIKQEDFLEEYSSIKKYLIKNGFNNYEISNFWKKWYECNHNISYWNHKQVHAFWMWAWGLIKEDNKYIRYLNADNFKDYYSDKKIFENKLKKNDIFLEKLMFDLRTSWLEKDIYQKLDLKKIDYFIENWYLIKKFEKIILSDSWILLMDYILGEII